MAAKRGGLKPPQTTPRAVPAYDLWKKQRCVYNRVCGFARKNLVKWVSLSKIAPLDSDLSTG